MANGFAWAPATTPTRASGRTSSEDRPELQCRRHAERHWPSPTRRRQPAVGKDDGKARQDGDDSRPDGHRPQQLHGDEERRFRVPRTEQDASEDVPEGHERKQHGTQEQDRSDPTGTDASGEQGSNRRIPDRDHQERANRGIV